MRYTHTVAIRRQPDDTWTMMDSAAVTTFITKGWDEVVEARDRDDAVDHFVNRAELRAFVRQFGPPPETEPPYDYASLVFTVLSGNRYELDESVRVGDLIEEMPPRSSLHADEPIDEAEKLGWEFEADEHDAGIRTLKFRRSISRRPTVEGDD